MATGPAYATGVQLFPVSASLVPLVVAAVFMLPALVAGLWSMARRLSLRGIAPVLGVGVLVVVAALLAAYANPSLLASLRI